jgi:hypothetical protein
MQSVLSRGLLVGLGVSGIPRGLSGGTRGQLLTGGAKTSIFSLALARARGIGRGCLISSQRETPRGKPAASSA